MEKKGTNLQTKRKRTSLFLLVWMEITQYADGATWHQLNETFPGKHGLSAALSELVKLGNIARIENSGVYEGRSRRGRKPVLYKLVKAPFIPAYAKLVDLGPKPEQEEPPQDQMGELFNGHRAIAFFGTKARRESNRVYHRFIKDPSQNRLSFKKDVIVPPATEFVRLSTEEYESAERCKEWRKFQKNRVKLRDYHPEEFAEFMKAELALVKSRREGETTPEIFAKDFTEYCKKCKLHVS